MSRRHNTLRLSPIGTVFGLEIQLFFQIPTLGSCRDPFSDSFQKLANFPDRFREVGSGKIGSIFPWEKCPENWLIF
jgi:hypothetical protein